MEVTFTIEVKLPEVTVENVVVDGRGNADFVLSAAGVQVKCFLDAAGSDHGTILDALLTLAGIHIASKNEVMFKWLSTNYPARRTSATV